MTQPKVSNKKLEWFVIAERESGGPLCIDYGWQDVPFGEMDLSKALQAAVADLQERFDYGWKLQDSEETRSADIVLLDCHWETDALYEACSWHQSWMPALGFGYQQHKATYHAPRKRGDAAPILGDAWHVVVMSRAFDGIMQNFRVAESNADVWKLRLQRSLSVDVKHPQAMLLPNSADPNGRRELAKHLTAEKQVSEYVAGQGTVLKFVSTYYKNHWLDAGYMAMVGQSILSHRNTQPRTFTLPEGRRRG
ncbi:MAG: hypothetical protein GY878_09370 [Fuerstiella sp.]|nr:hypothetical protein [Fuerstiella sp.]